MGEMYPEGDPLYDLDDSYITVPVHIEFFLRGRPEPYIVRASFPIGKDSFDGLDEAEDLEVFVDTCVTSMLSVLDIRGEERYVFTDGRKNKFIVIRTEVQAVSILAPDAQTIQGLLAASE